MKLAHLVAFGVASCAGFAAYQAYQKREQYTQEITDVNDISNRIVDDISKISRSIEDINQQLPKLESISKDLDYKRRLFEQETNSRLEEIGQILGKYQEATNEKA
ncbi:hypothetical protein SAMN05216470_1559 [Streptococcus equinus]|uniref:Uncharacterized protein n=1 Tax=Streptococcus equinus TaxID=1335 RepID=A0A1G9NDJ5_STREI|nr:hypothetical protein [Streptococcus equinus]SDL84401.1 hypothetical protein SAMN05216400_1752 [Streptococcus equinus]SFQ73530.1 hypothetical protein SAMN05216422_1518 [Streptococcus equinus]SNU08987.1 hypothetical protein SAMN05216470_1559 [Streptococcus equinus]